MRVSIRHARCVYFPFSKDVRSCVGESFAWMETVLLLANLGKCWKLSLMPEKKIALHPMITLRPKFGMKMRIEQR